ncbi:MAG TPA: hypothetical protein VD971_13405 [Phycisphaerales bacterium]|nr:hypothetical protein [Phycisphaerales bacterium]
MMHPARTANPEAPTLAADPAASARLARLDTLPAPTRARALADALRHCSASEAAVFAPALVQLCVSPVTERQSPPPDSRAADESTVEFLRRKYGFVRETAPWHVRAWRSLRTARERRAMQDADDALSAAAGVFRHLPPESRSALLAVGEGRWSRCIDRQSTDADTLGSHALLAGAACDAGLSGRLVQALESGDEVAATHALASLFSLCLVARRDAMGGDEDAWRSAAESHPLWELHLSRGLLLGLRGQERDLARALEAALRSYPSHGRRGVALSVLALADLRSRWIAAGDPDSPHGAVMHMLRGEPSPALLAIASTLRFSRWHIARLRAFEWLGLAPLHKGLAHGAVARLATTRGHRDHEVVLRSWHLLLSPRRAAAVAGVVVRGRRRASTDGDTGASTAPEGGALPTPSQIDQLSVAARRGLALWACAIRADAPLRAGALAPLLKDADALTRMMLARRAPASLLHDCALDADARVSRHAALRLADDARQRGGAGRHAPDRSLRVLMMHPSPATRALAQRESRLAGGAPETAAMLRALSRDPERVAADVRESLASPDPARVLRTLRTVAAARAAGLAGERLIELALLHRDDAGWRRVAATSVAALGAVPGEAAEHALLAALDAPDQRVRANAVEAAARRRRAAGAGVDARIVELKGDANHRVRANAMLACAAAGRHAGKAEHEANGEALLGILADTRPAHRLAGVWLAGRLLAGPARAVLGERWALMSARVAEIARFDEDLAVRRRAAACAAIVEARTRATWRSAVREGADTGTLEGAV